MLHEQFANIISLIRQSQANAVRAVNTELINLYWQVGEYISKQVTATAWGEKTVDELSEYISKTHPEIKGFNRRGLYRMKQFYELYNNLSIVSSVSAQLQNIDNQSNIIVSTVSAQFELSDIRNTLLTKISWSHHLLIMSRCRQPEEIEFYLKQGIKENYSVRELDRQISSSLFERVMISNHKLSATIKEVHPDIANHFKDSYIFEFLNLPEPYSEGDLKKALIRQMKQFILELGKDYLFVGEEYKVHVGNRDFFIDLIFYHRGLQCLVAFELKTDRFEPEHLGKLNFYLEALDRDVKKQNEKPSIGILLCKDKDAGTVEYALNRVLSPTLIAEYKTQLPDKKLLQQKLNEIFENTSLHFKPNSQ
jgi:predicted nuclease of restriction endonuclease-like (RecB) superfamily